MVVITRAEIDTLGSGEDLVEMIRTKVCDLIVTGTVVPLQGSRQGVSFPRA
jgi:hypothetical protein